MKKEQTQYEKDCGASLSINGNQSSKGYYNLVVSIRDLSLYSKGIKPHRNWRITDLKWYFGIKGNAVKMLEQLKEMRDN
jgi:hypothetical protein